MVAFQGGQVQQERGRRGVLAQRMQGVLVDKQEQEVLVDRQQVQVHRWPLVHKQGRALEQHREGAQVQVAENDKLAG